MLGIADFHLPVFNIYCFARQADDPLDVKSDCSFGCKTITSPRSGSRKR